MKKALSLFLAVLMIFAAMSVSASAINIEPGDTTWFEGTGAPADKTTQAVICFDLGGGTLKNAVYVYDLEKGTFSVKENVAGKYYMVPLGPDSMKANSTVSLPVVTAPTGYQFDGWYCEETRSTYAANGLFLIDEGMVGNVVHFRAAYSPATLEPDTMTKVMGILTKVFGAVIGLFMFAGDTSAGVALMEKILGGIFA